MEWKPMPSWELAAKFSFSGSPFCLESPGCRLPCRFLGLPFLLKMALLPLAVLFLQIHSPDSAAAQEPAPADPDSAGQRQAYTAPSGGYSAPFGYGQSSQDSAPAGLLRSGLPGWPSMNQGIVSSHMTAPVLPEGLVLPILLDTAIDTNKMNEGDYVQAHLTQNISSGGLGYLPGASVFSGLIVKAEEEKQFGRAGKFSISFQQVKLPSGRLLPLKAHLVGRIGSYFARDPEGAGGKFLSNAWHNGVGSELRYGAGTTFGSYFSHGYGPGGGAYAGAAMGGVSQVMASIFCHPHHDRIMQAGTAMEMQLDQALVLPATQDSHEFLPGSGKNTGIF